MKLPGRWWAMGVALTGCLIAVTGAAPPASRIDVGPSRTECGLAARDSAWVSNALSGWQRQNDRALHAPRTRFPILVLFDSLCSHTLAPALRPEVDVAFV